MATTAFWTPGMESLFHNADPQKVAYEISQLGAVVKPEQIVGKARDEESELHKCFTWDDAEAAEKYRLVEARRIVLNLKYVPNPAHPDTPIRVFQKGDGGGYKPAEYIFRMPEETESALARALAELDAFRKKYHTLLELASIFKELDQIQAVASAGRAKSAVSTVNP